MYDTVNLWLPMDRAGRTDLLTCPEKYLSGFTEHKRDEQVYVSGWLRNYKVNISEQGISFKGSLAKYFLNDNYQTLTRGDTQRAVEMMADELHLPMDRAKVSRADLATNIIVKHSTEAYYSSLGDCVHYIRLVQPQALYYNSGRGKGKPQRVKHFYNKIAEGKSKGIPIPEIWRDENVLRYEMRYMSRLSAQFNLPEVTASVLYDEIFYIAAVNRYVQEYEKINKLKNYITQIDKPMTAAEFKNDLLAVLISQVGQNDVMEIAKQRHRQNGFSTDREYYRAKQEIKQLIKKLPDGQNELITELDKKIRAVKQFYR